MRHLLAFVLMLALVGTAAAADLGNSSNVVKGNSHVLMNQSWDRQGGEDMASAVAITAIPFMDTGATCDNLDDYDVACPYTDSTSPDVVYSFTPAADIIVSVDLLGSLYDTKTYVLDAAMNVIGCNDDFYTDYVSFIEMAPMTAGVTYYIVIDGYGGDCGDYVLNVVEYIEPEPCFLTCDGVAEGEPALTHGYDDEFNSGCNGLTQTFLNLESEDGTLTFCGVGGWNLDSTETEVRDTDWMIATFGEAGIIEWTVDAESEVNCYTLLIPDCETASVDQSMIAGPCAPATMTIQGTPGSVAFLWVGSSSFTQVDAGHPTTEFAYTMDITGLLASVAVENASWDSVKSLYR